MSIFDPTAEAVADAAAAIRHGELVGMPTETVYGIAGDALNPAAIEKIFALKGRPADNPLIVHLATPEDLEQVAQDIPEVAYHLAEAFWPGPLTMVLRKRETVPLVTTGGLQSVAVRVARHPVARALIRLSQRPIAAPSANIFMGLSPTQAQHIDPKIADGLAMILDGGPCEIGIESTVIDLTIWPPKILRLGGLELSKIDLAIGATLSQGVIAETEERKSPGQYSRHYAPQTPIKMVESAKPNQPALVFHQSSGPHQISMPRNPHGYAQSLYSALYELDQKGFETIWVEMPPQTPPWEAVWDRLRRASNYS